MRLTADGARVMMLVAFREVAPCCWGGAESTQQSAALAAVASPSAAHAPPPRPPTKRPPPALRTSPPRYFAKVARIARPITLIPCDMLLGIFVTIFVKKYFFGDHVYVTGGSLDLKIHVLLTHYCCFSYRLSQA